MNEEIEIKVVLKNPIEIEKRLQEIAKFVKEKKQIDSYFVPKHKDFFAQKPVFEYLRVRHEEGKNSIDYSFCHFAKDKSLLKTDEYETKIENPESMETILEKLGMEKIVTVTKHRKCFDYKDFEILLDNIPGVGFFLEIEAKKIFNNPEETKKKCFEILEELNADWEKAPNMGYPDMVLAKKHSQE